MRPAYRRVANAALLVALSLVCGVLAAGIQGWYGERDFNCFYVAGRIVASGGDPYDVAQFRPAVMALPPSPAFALERCGQRLSYPPWTAVALALFGALPLRVAATLWSSLSVVAAVLGIYWTWRLVGNRRIPWPLVALLVIGTEPFVRVLLEGQFAAFTFAFTAGAALSFRTLRDVPGGMATAALSVKPHTSVGFAAAVLGLAVVRRRWRFLGAAVVSGLALATLTQLLRPGLAARVLDRRDRPERLHRGPRDDLETRRLRAGRDRDHGRAPRCGRNPRSWTPPRRQRHPRSRGGVQLVVAPYAWSHDFVVLAVPWSMTIAYARDLPVPQRRALMYATVTVAAPLLWTSRRRCRPATASRSRRSCP